MSFITKTDITKNILLEELDEITRGDDSIIDHAIDAAVGEAQGYLTDSFRVDEIFAATGSGRHPLLVTLVSDMAIYIIMSLGQAGTDMEDRRARYKRALEWLKGVRDSQIITALPKKETTYENKVSYSSKLKRGNHY